MYFCLLYTSKPDYSVGKKILKPYLLKNGVGKIDGAFVTHLHTDHYKGIAELCREGMAVSYTHLDVYKRQEWDNAETLYDAATK